MQVATTLLGMLVFILLLRDTSSVIISSYQLYLIYVYSIDLNRRHVRWLVVSYPIIVVCLVLSGGHLLGSCLAF